MIYLFFILLLVAWRINKKTNVLINALFIVYLISAFCAILLTIIEPDSVYLYKTNYFPLWYLFLVLIVFFNGFSAFNLNLVRLNANRNSILKASEWIGWIFVPVVLLLLYNDINVLSSISLSDYRTEHNYYETGLFKGGIFLSLCIYLSELSFVPHFLFFYLLSLRRVNLYLKVRLFFASFSLTLMTLMFAGRDGIVYWVMNSLVFYWMFKGLYSSDTKRTMKHAAVYIMVILAIPFFAISDARFNVMKGGTFVDFISPFVDYMGQAPHNFCQSFYVDPLSVKGYDISKITSSDAFEMQLYLQWTFGTFVKTFLWRYGKIATLIIAFLFNYLSRFTIRSYNRNHNIWLFFIIYILYQIPLYGVFYYRQSVNNMDIVHAIFAIICVIMLLFRNRKTIYS